MLKDNPDKPISKIKKQANISGRVLAFLIAVTVLAPLAVLHGCGVKGEPVYGTGIEPWQATEAFKGVQEYTVWGPDGIESMGAASEVTLELLEGDARFIEFKTFTD
ncbi:MAG: hypothetical protein K6B54_07475 [Clostridia bacterium]|nr:hypothetical protein [Clostridia bacterium]